MVSSFNRFLGFFSVVCLLTTLASPAYADGKVYGTANWNNAPKLQGGYANLYVATGYANDVASGGHINQTLWVGTDNATSGQYWVEGGYTYGYHSNNVLTYYWAHQSPVYGYGDHQVTSITPTVGNWEPVEIKYAGINSSGNPQYNVYFNWQLASGPDGSTVAVGNSSPGYCLSTGLESTSAYNTLNTAYSSSLEYMDANGNWINGWSATLVPTGANVSWVTVDTEISDSL